MRRELLKPKLMIIFRKNIAIKHKIALRFSIFIFLKSLQAYLGHTPFVDKADEQQRTQYHAKQTLIEEFVKEAK